MTAFTLRPPTDEDIPALIRLGDEIAAELGIETQSTEADFRLTWTLPGFDPERHYRVAEADGTIVGSAAVRVQDERAQVSGRVAAHARGRGIGTALMRWMLEAAGDEDGVTEVTTHATSRQPDAVSLVERHGFEHERTFFRMLHASPATIAAPEWPDGVRVADDLEGDHLVASIIAAFDGSFIDHWDFHPMREDDLRHQLTHPSMEPDLLFLAFGPDDAIAGLNLCFLERGDTFCRGVVGVLGTTRPFRGIGLGRALLRHGVRALAARGATEVELGVDSANPSGALGLYERNGFDLSMEQRVYRRALA